MSDAKTPGRLEAWKTAEDWYNPDAIFQSIARQKKPLLIETHHRIPTDILSREFSDWLTNQYRLAMAKGIDMANSRNAETCQPLLDRITELVEVSGELADGLRDLFWAVPTTNRQDADIYALLARAGAKLKT